MHNGGNRGGGHRGGPRHHGPRHRRRRYHRRSCCVPLIAFIGTVATIIALIVN